MSRMTAVLKRAMPAILLVAVQLAVAAEPERRQPTPADAPESLLRKYLEALDRLDMDGAKLIAKRAAEQSPGPITELMLRHTRLLAAGKSDTLPKAESRQKPRVDRKNVLYTVTYNVADLVLPPPQRLVTANPASAEAKNNQTTPEADFDSLIDLIASTVKPTTWDTVGGPGSITPFKTNLSIVVTQTQAVHKEITVLLEQLRRLQDISVMVESRIVVLPGDAVPEGSREKLDQWAALPNPWQNGERPDTRRTTLDPQQLRRLVDAASKNGATTAFRRVTTMNGQMAAMSFPAENGKVSWAEIQAVVSNDCRRVRLTLVLDRKQTLCASVTDGRTFVADLTPATDQPQKSDRRPAEAKSAAPRRLLLLTPHIIIAEEEEERLGVLPAARK